MIDIKMHKMSKFATAIAVLVLILLSCGEKEKIVEVPVETDCPPAVPRGVFAYNLDGYVQICWYPNTEDDIDGYDVWYGEEAYGDYFYIGSVWAVYPDPFEYCFSDTTGNGNQYYYAVSAFDESGNESELSYEVVSGTPRPEGLLILYEYTYLPEESGYDFSTQSNVPQRFDLATSDIYFASDGGANEITAFRPGVDIQDYGYVGDFDLINYAPEEGWSAKRSAEAIYGHVYILRLDHTPKGYHYAKLYVTEVTVNFVTFMWAYQTDPGNRDLAPAPDGGSDDRGIVLNNSLTGGTKVKVHKGYRVGRQFPPSFREGNMETEHDLQ